MEELLEMTPEAEVFAIASKLIGVQHAVAMSFGGKCMDADAGALQETVRSMLAIINFFDGAYGVIIGGLAVQHHGYERFTQGVDVVVDRAHFRVVKMRETSFKLDPKFYFIDESSGVRVNLFQEGSKLVSSIDELPHPSALGKNGWFADLPALIYLKLESHRLQDLADIVALMRTHQDKKESISASLPARYKTQFEDLAAQAQAEIEAATTSARAMFENID